MREPFRESAGKPRTPATDPRGKRDRVGAALTAAREAHGAKPRAWWDGYRAWLNGCRRPPRGLGASGRAMRTGYD